MRVRVKIIETKQIVRTYEVDGVNSLETAGKCAERCSKHLFQPNAYLYQEVPQRSTYEIGAYEIVDCG